MQMDFLCLEAADRVQILEGMKMRPSSLTLFILAPERIALTSRLKGEGRGWEGDATQLVSEYRTRPSSARVTWAEGMMLQLE